MAAIDDLKAILDYYGLSSLTDVLSKRIEDDPTIVTNRDVLINSVRDTPEYKERFKANEIRRARGLPEKSPFEIVEYENAYRDTLRANSLPRGFYDTQEDFNNFIGSNVSPAELQARISQGYNAVMQAEPGTKEELKQLYGLQDSDIAAFFLDPERFQQSEAIKKAQAATAASEARRQAGISLSVQQAEALATEGVDRGTARAGFSQIAEEQGLYAPQFRDEQAMTTEEQIAGTFGTSAEAAQRIATRRRRRKAEFESGGSFAATSQGITGLGTTGQ